MEYIWDVKFVDFMKYVNKKIKLTEEEFLLKTKGDSPIKARELFNTLCTIYKLGMAERHYLKAVHYLATSMEH